MKPGKIFLIFCLIAGITLVSFRDLFLPGFFPMHDDTQPARVIQMAKALQDGQFPVRVVRDLGYGYGYPLFEFYAPLPYYVGAGAYLAGFDGIVATKIMMGLGMALAGFAMLALGNIFWGLPGALVSAALYLYFPYHAIQLFVRGAVGELYAYAFLPLVVFGLFLTHKTETKKKGFLLSVLALSGVILSHTIYGYLAVVIMSGAIIMKACIALVKKQSWKPVLLWMLILLFALDGTAFFWLPAVFEMGTTAVAKVVGTHAAVLADHFVCLPQLWHSEWGFGGSSPGCVDGMSFSLGKLHIILFLIALIFGIGLKRIQLTHKKLLIGIVVAVAVSLFFVLPQSVWVWNILPKSEFVQYPWRLLPITGLGMSLASGILPTLVKGKRWPWIIAAVIAAAVCVSQADKFRIQYPTTVTTGKLESVADISWRVSKISDEYLPKDFRVPQNISDIASSLVVHDPGVSVVVREYKSQKFSFSLTTPVKTTIRINRLYFPGFTYFVNGKKIVPAIVNGLPEMVLSVGTSEVVGVLGNTPIRAFANVLSFTTAISLIILAYAKKTNA